MQVTNFEFDTDTGFAWIIVDGKNEGDQWSVQCCLTQPKWNPEEEKMPKFNMEIDQDNCGHDDGICGDANVLAFEYWGENRCMTALFLHAEKNGIELV